LGTERKSALQNFYLFLIDTLTGLILTVVVAGSGFLVEFLSKFALTDSNAWMKRFLSLSKDGILALSVAFFVIFMARATWEFLIRFRSDRPTNKGHSDE